MKRQWRAPSPALVISVIALFVALGGTSYAAINSLPRNSVGTPQLKNGAVTGAKIKHGTVPNSTQLGGVSASHWVRPGSTLASEDTETGVFGASVPASDYGVASITFIPKLPAAPTVKEYITDTPDSHCPGHGHAAAGYLCVYEGFSNNATMHCIGGPASACGTQPTVDGAEIYFNSTGTFSNVVGWWAYTAP